MADRRKYFQSLGASSSNGGRAGTGDGRIGVSNDGNRKAFLASLSQGVSSKLLGLDGQESILIWLACWNSKGVARSMHHISNHQTLHACDLTMIAANESSLQTLKFDKGSWECLTSFVLCSLQSGSGSLLDQWVFLVLQYLSFNAIRQSDNGASFDRVRNLVNSGTCRCHRGKCFGKFVAVLNELMKFIRAFWDLEKPAQDAYDKDSVVQVDVIQACLMCVDSSQIELFGSLPGLRSMKDWRALLGGTEPGPCATSGFLVSAWQPCLGSGPKGFDLLVWGKWIIDIDVLGQNLDLQG